MSSPTEDESAAGRDTAPDGDDNTADDLEHGGDQEISLGTQGDRDGVSAPDELSEERLSGEIPGIDEGGDVDGEVTDEGGPKMTSSTTTPEVPPDAEFGDGGSTPDPQDDEQTPEADINDLNMDLGQDDLNSGQSDLALDHGDQDQSGGAEADATHSDQLTTGDQVLKDGTAETGLAANPGGDLQDLGPEVSQQAPPGTADGSHYETIGRGALQGVGRRNNISLAVNQSAIEASARNKLPITEVKGLVSRVSRPTESSSHKNRIWYKNENYVDKDTYSWTNLRLFDDHQRHLWTTEGAVRQTFKK